MPTNEEIVTAIQSGSGNEQELLEQLYLQNAGMIERIIRRYQDIEELDDLRQEAFFGIRRAAQLWNPDSGAAFISYAGYWIRSAVRQYIDKCGAVVRISSDRRDQIGQYYRALNSYRVQFGCDPSGPELCALLDVPGDQLEEIRKAAQALKVRSTSEVIGGENDDLTLGDTIPDERDEIGEMLEQRQHKQLAGALRSEVDQLEPQQAAVIRGRYTEGWTLDDCGAALGITPGKVKRLEFKALQELREPRHARRLLPFLSDRAAYSYGISNTGRGIWEQSGNSSQEIAVMKLEEFYGVNLNGVKMPITT